MIFVNKEEKENEITTGMPRRLNMHQVFVTVYLFLESHVLMNKKYIMCDLVLH